MSKKPSTYGAPPIDLGPVKLDLREVMYYLYLPIAFPFTEDPTLHTYLPANLKACGPLLLPCLEHATKLGRNVTMDYMYISARHGWATPDNPLNRPGWHADGFGTDDLNFVWWKGPGTRFLLGDFGYIPEDHVGSMEQFERIAKSSPMNGMTQIESYYPEGHLYAIDPYVVHATPVIAEGCWRQYIKVSLSRHRYNLERNSHNHLFQYDWPLHSRKEVRNDTFKAQRDYA